MVPRVVPKVVPKVASEGAALGIQDYNVISKKMNKMKEFEIRCDESRLEKNHTLYGKFIIGPFLPGQGTTFGNALRRSLLSELSGLGITAFEIIGVMQEFATLPGLRESVLDLSLNLKQIVLTGILPRSTPPIGFLKVRGPAVIHAADLKLPAGIHCVSPEQYIGTLASNGTLNLKFLVSVGKGHLTQPYSLYRSLSKIKLQPTISTNPTNILNETSSFNDEWKNSLDSVAEFQFWKNQSSASSVQPVQRNVAQMMQESKNKKDVSFLLSNSKMGVASGDQTSKMHKGNNGSEFLNPVNFVNNKPLTNPSLTINKSIESTYPVNKQSDFNATNSISYDNNINSIDFANGKSLNYNSLGYATIQKQIFQRVNPHQVLPIDAVFTPVSQVNFLTQINDRFETPGENVVLEIWTNGSIHPKRALEEAALSLVQNFDALVKSIQQASSFYRGIRYRNSFQFSNVNSVKSVQSVQPKVAQIAQISNKNIGVTEDGKKVGLENSRLPRGEIKDFKEKAIYNLDIGNLNLSLETFLLLKQAKVKTLAELFHLLQSFSSKQHHAAGSKFKSQVIHAQNENVLLNKGAMDELNKVVNQLGIQLS